jgi:hypothetical protein
MSLIDGLKEIAIAGRKDAIFLFVEKETEKAVMISFYGKNYWLPKSAFVLNKKISKECKSNFFNLKSFFADKICQH